MAKISKDVSLKMQFNSFEFVLLFLPVSVLGYYLFNKISVIAGKLWLIAASLVFYIYAGLPLALGLIVSILLNYIFALYLSASNRGRKLVFVIAILLNAAALLYFKYHDFFIDQLSILGYANPVEKALILPLGISFFTFQQIAYLAFVYKAPQRHCGLVNYLLYVLFFPKLIMGPITEPDYIIPQFDDEKRKKADFNYIAAGVKTFSFGLFKKVFFADAFAAAASWGLEHSGALGSAELFLTMLSYTFEIYFDFSGYSDMATGIAMMLNIDLPINFESPYKALSIRYFWKRWHISLTSFLTKYVYIPLGGSRKGAVRTYINTMIVFLVSGIWHGANWTFILWGLLHGALSVLERIFEKTYSKLSETVRWLMTFLTVNILWLLFACESIGQWGFILKKMLLVQDAQIDHILLEKLVIPETVVFSDFINKVLFGVYPQYLGGLFAMLFIAAALAVCLIPENNYKTRTTLSASSLVPAALAFVWGVISLGGVSSFVYFGF